MDNMPTTKAGAKVLAHLRKEYPNKSPEEVKRIYYALQVEGKGGKGKHKWEGKGGMGKLDKAKATYAKRHGKVAKAASKVMTG
jgi:hypothetical protein